jgi:hypothetical protein
MLEPNVGKYYLRRIVVLEGDLPTILSEATAQRIEFPAGEVWAEALRLRAAFALIIEQGNFPDNPCDDVYQAALSLIKREPDWESCPSLERLYRGQRNVEWDVIPLLFRDEPTSDQIGLDLGRVQCSFNIFSHSFLALEMRRGSP